MVTLVSASDQLPPLVVYLPRAAAGVATEHPVRDWPWRSSNANFVRSLPLSPLPQLNMNFELPPGSQPSPMGISFKQLTFSVLPFSGSEGNGYPLQYSCQEHFMDRGSDWGWQSCDAFAGSREGSVSLPSPPTRFSWIPGSMLHPFSKPAVTAWVFPTLRSALTFCLHPPCLRTLVDVHRLPRWRWLLKNPLANVGDIRDMGLIPGLGRSSEGGHGNPLQYFCLGNPTDRGASWDTVHDAAESDMTEST